MIGRWSIWVIALAGCGSAGSANQDAGSGPVTTVDGSTPLSTLTAGQAAQLCADTTAYERRFVSASDNCKIASVTQALQDEFRGIATTDAQLQASCASVYGSCPGSGSADGGTVQCQTAQLLTCAATATVDEYSACVADMTAGAVQEARAFPGCSALTGASVTTTTAGLMQAVDAPNCTKFFADCPAVVIDP
jgi:hypothetical protein